MFYVPILVNICGDTINAKLELQWFIFLQWHSQTQLKFDIKDNDENYKDLRRMVHSKRCYITKKVILVSTIVMFLAGSSSPTQRATCFEKEHAWIRKDCVSMGQHIWACPFWSQWIVGTICWSFTFMLIKSAWFTFKQFWKMAWTSVGSGPVWMKLYMNCNIWLHTDSNRTTFCQSFYSSKVQRWPFLRFWKSD
jgi:hypothetical protein